VGKHNASGFKGRLAAGIAGAALVLGIPSAGLAVGLIDADDDFASLKTLATFTPASADPEMARMMEARGTVAGMVRFTPAGRDKNAGRAVTVAVRVDEEAAQAISVRNAINTVREPAAQEAAPRIAPTRYNLGLARGYRSFAQAPALSQPLSMAAIPDLSQFVPSPGVREEPSRFAARIELGEEERPNTPAPRSLDAVGDQSLDVAGSYRLTRNLDVTAGVRYQQDRNRLSPLPNLEQLDSQAVYVGTQFRF
jgi:hypothetical protein